MAESYPSLDPFAKAANWGGLWMGWLQKSDASGTSSMSSRYYCGVASGDKIHGAEGQRVGIGTG